MNATESQRSTAVEPESPPEGYPKPELFARTESDRDDLCKHDLPAPTCAVCTRNADGRDAGFMSEFGGDSGFDYYGELGMSTKGWK